MSYSVKNIYHYGDIIAIPGFLLAFIYFYDIEDKTPIEYFLLVGSFSGFIIDVIFTYLFLTNKYH